MFVGAGELRPSPKAHLSMQGTVRTLCPVQCCEVLNASWSSRPCGLRRIPEAQTCPRSHKGRGAASAAGPGTFRLWGRVLSGRLRYVTLGLFLPSHPRPRRSGTAQAEAGARLHPASRRSGERQEATIAEKREGERSPGRPGAPSERPDLGHAAEARSTSCPGCGRAQAGRGAPAARPGWALRGGKRRSAAGPGRHLVSARWIVASGVVAPGLSSPGPREEPQ